MPAVTLSALVAEIARQLAAFLAVLLCASAVHKALAPAASVAAASALTGLRRVLARLAVGAAGAVELLAGLGLLQSTQRGRSALAALLLLTVYLSLLGRAVIAGRRSIDCGCSFGGPQRQLGFFELGRNATLIVMAAAVAAAARAGLAGVLEPRHYLIGLAAFALYLAIEAVASLEPIRRVA